MGFLRFLPLLLVLLLPGCASYEVVRLPERQADLYPLAEEQRGIWMAIDDISEPRRARRFFGSDLRERGILPVEVIVSNRGSERISVGPADVLMLRGMDVVDPLPLENVARVVKDRGGIVTSSTSEQLDALLEDVAFRQRLLAPGESHHGVLFFDVVEERSPVTRFFRLLSLYPQAGWQIRAAVTDVDSRRRIPFGPFAVYR